MQSHTVYRQTYLPANKYQIKSNQYTFKQDSAIVSFHSVWFEKVSDILVAHLRLNVLISVFRVCFCVFSYFLIVSLCFLCLFSILFSI